jgi:ABC-2 type transport system permease protein
MSRTVWVILRREYLAKVKTKGFWIATALFPLLIFASAVLPSLIAQKGKGSREPILVVDLVGDFYPMVQASLLAMPPGERLPLKQETPDTRHVPTLMTDLNRRAELGDIQGYIVVDHEAVTGEKELIYFARNPSGIVMNETLRALMRNAVTRYRLARAGVSDQQIATAFLRVRFGVQKATNDPARRETDTAALFMTFGLVLAMYASLMMYGVHVLRGVLEEKSSRIVEIIISSVSSTDLMLGKIIGIGAVGLTQVCIWSIGSFLVTAPQLVSALSISPVRMPAVHFATAIFLPVYFLLGYLLFSTIFAAIGAMFSSEEDAQQMVIVAQLLVATPMFLFLPVLSNPSGTLATTLSLIPFLGPTLMYLRIVTETPPGWQIALSIALIVATILVMAWLTSKIYRVGILMYGKKPTLPELWSWLRYT